MKKTSLLLVFLLVLVVAMTACTFTPAESTTAATEPTLDFTVSFEGAAGVASQKVEQGGFAAEPTAPKKDGYTFLGWFDQDGNAFDFASTPIVGDISLKAKWEAITFDVTFYGAQGEVLSVVSVEWGKAVSRLHPAIADNQEFRGWFTAPGGEGEAFAIGTPVYADTSYYAHIVTGAYLRFNGEDGHAIVVYFLEEGQTATAPKAPDKSGVGKDFVGWFDENGNAFDPAATYTANAVYTAKYNQSVIVVKFMSQGTLLHEIRLQKGEAVEKPADPVRGGYIFEGWALNGEVYDFAQPVEDNITLTAIWTAEPVIPPTPEYTVSFAGEGVSIPAQTVKEGEAAEKPADPVREGFVFGGWLLGGEAYDFASPVTGDITLTAVWTAEVIEDHTVTFVDGEGNVLSTQTVPHGGNATMPTFSGDTYFAYDLSKLVNVKTNVTVVVTPVAKSEYAEKDYFISVDMVNNDERVTFDGFNASWGALLWNMGQSFSFTEEFAGRLRIKPYAPADKYAEGQSITIEVAVDGIALARYTVDGAFTRLYYTVHDNLPAGVHTITITVVEMVGITSPDKYGCAVGLANIMFQEKQAPVVKHTVSFAGEGVNIPAQEIAEGQKAQKPADPVREGFVFAGWLLNGVAYDFSAPVNGDITLTASWTEQTTPPVEPTEFTVTFVDGEGNVIATETVAPGENAKLPTSADFFYEFSPADALYNISESKTVVLTPVSKAAYSAPTELSTLNASAYTHAGMSTTGKLKNYATLLYRVGQEFNFTANMAGLLQIKFAQFGMAEGQSITFVILVDGVVVNQFVMDSDFVRGFYEAAYIPTAGEHTVTVRVTEMAGVASPNYDWQVALGVCNLIVSEKLVAPTEHTVTFAGEGVDIPAQTVANGGVATKPADPVREGFVFEGWTLDGVAYDFATPVVGDITLTASWTEQTTPPVEPTEFTVKFVDAEGNVLASEVVAPGANASIPTLSGDTYFAYDLAQLLNIQADTTILVTPVAKSEYAEKDYFISVDMIKNDERVTFDGFNASWGALLWKMGQSFSFTEEIAGVLKIKPYAPANKFAEGQSITIEVAVDGIALARYTVDGAFTRQYYTVHNNLPAGEHTITITVVEMVGIGSPDKYGCAVGLANVLIKEKLAPVVEHTVTFAGEGVDIPAQTVANGGVATKPADPVREGFVFEGWTLDGVAYDFATPVVGNITLTATWKEEIVAPTEYTVKFVDAEGNVLASEVVAPGANASIPTLGGDTYFAYDLAQLQNIQADTTILVTPTAKSEYAEKDYFISVDMINNDERVTFDGFNASWGALLWKMGQSFSFTEEIAGVLKIKPYAPADKFAEGQSITIEVAVDGIALARYTVDGAFKRQFYTVHNNLPAGEHTITITVVEMVGIDSPNKYGCAVGLANVLIKEKLAPVVEHTVTFAGEGVNIPAQTVADGGVATKPADPVREGFVFEGWLLEGVAYDFSAPVNGDITLTASWTEQATPPVGPTEFTVTFVDGEGNVIASETVEEGGNATLPESNEYFYTFAPVDALYNITESKTIVLGKVAKSDYAETRLDMTKSNANYADHFTVTDSSNNRITPATVLFKEGHSVTLKATMIGEVQFYISNQGGNLSADQWFDVEVQVDGKVVNVFRVDASYAHYATACYIGEYGEHEVKLTIVDFANMPDDNHKRGNVVWMNSCRIFEASAAPAPETHTVTFVGQDGTVLSTQEVEAGQGATAPEAPAVAGHTFAGWDVAFDNVTGDLTVTATYTVNVYTVTFLGKDGAVIGTVEVQHGAAATAPAAPEVDGFTFKSWDTAFEAVTDNLTVNAIYEENAPTPPAAEATSYSVMHWSFGANNHSNINGMLNAVKAANPDIAILTGVASNYYSGKSIEGYSMFAHGASKTNDAAHVAGEAFNRYCGGGVAIFYKTDKFTAGEFKHKFSVSDRVGAITMLPLTDKTTGVTIPVVAAHFNINANKASLTTLAADLQSIIGDATNAIIRLQVDGATTLDVKGSLTTGGMTCGEGVDIRKEDYINSTAVTAGVHDCYLLSYSNGTISSAISNVAAIESTKDGSKYAVLQKTNQLFYTVAFTFTFTVG